MYEDLGVPFIADHIRSLTERFDTKFVGVVNPLFRQLGRHNAERGLNQVSRSYPAKTEIDRLVKATSIS
jgi:hypothetical protein